MEIKPFPEIENIHSIPMPFDGFPMLITANVFLIGNGPFTLIDTGPKTSTALEFLREGIKEAGLNFRDLKRIIISHGHLDHYGQAASIQKTFGKVIECYIHRNDLWRVSGRVIHNEVWNKEALEFMATAGVPEEKILKIRQHYFSLRALWDPLKKAIIMNDGDEFIGENYCLEVIHTPGHTQGSCCLFERREKILFSGDHIIKHITPSPLVEIKPKRFRDRGYQSLKAYLKSLDRVMDLDVRYVFPGHGEYVKDLVDIISRYRIHHRQRMDLIWEALYENPKSVYDLVDDVFPDVIGEDLFLAVSEIYAHLDLMIGEGRAELMDYGPPALYGALLY